MDKKSINELRRRLKKDGCTFTKICGCYIDDNKNKVTNLDEIFLNLEDEEYFKYLEIAKKVLSTNVGNNILELNFPLEEEKPGGHQQFLLGLKKSGLKDQGLLDTFYDMVIEKYNSLGNYLILLFHDVYDVMTKTTDNNKLDESEEVYEYIICAICPMVLSKPGLGYNKDKNKISTLNREWFVGMPETGFVFPAFIDRSSDIHSVLMYTADSKNVHTEMIEDILGCREKLTYAQQQDVLTDMVLEVTGEDMVKDVMDTVNIELAHVSDENPESYVSKEHIKSALEHAGIAENKAVNIGDQYMSSINTEEVPLIGDIIPNKAQKIVKDNNEKELLKEEIKDLNRKIASIEETNDNNEQLTVDEGEIIITVNSEKKELIRRENIDGVNCVVIPVSESDHVKIN
ncbi:DUF4317 family protein [Eubacterium sp. AF36-5BH]|jgi:gas vesicle protein|uniref:DUF4317 domain-containing protein n=1 Tax=Eubacterium TaxID=1730 RepID=UPI000E468066|nr:DUF4317 domain-containing protein [Eubacterium sp. AF36-5BH]RGF51085.1 DUF4317 family protein [Eubacterium sp. AF36-5BH]